jgi:fatty acid desaturase
LYAVVAAVGVAVFLTLGVGFKTPAWVAAVVCITVTFVLRMLTVKFDIRTHPVHEHAVRAKAGHGIRSGVQRLRGTDPVPPAPAAEQNATDPDQAPP